MTSTTCNFSLLSSYKRSDYWFFFSSILRIDLEIQVVLLISISWLNSYTYMWVFAASDSFVTRDLKNHSSAPDWFYHRLTTHFCCCSTITFERPSWLFNCSKFILLRRKNARAIILIPHVSIFTFSTSLSLFCYFNCVEIFISWLLLLWLSTSPPPSSSSMNYNVYLIIKQFYFSSSFAS